MKLANLVRRTAGLVAVAALTVGLVAAGCDRGSSSGAKPVKLAFVTNNSSEYWKIAGNGIRKYEKEGKVKVEIIQPANGKAEEQNQILENLTSQGYDAVAVSVIAPKDQITVLNNLAAKSHLITVDSDAEQSNRLLYVGSLNYDAGKLLGEQIVKLLPNGGKIAVFVGYFSADNAAQRLKGIEDAIAGKNIEIVEKREDQIDREKARRNVEDVLNARGDLNLVCGLWSYNGPAIAAALEGSGKKGKVLAAVFDDEDGTLKGIENGTVQITVVQHPFEMGYQAAKWLHQLATSPDSAKTALPPNKVQDTGLEVVSQENIGEYQKKLAEWKQ